MRQVIIFFLPLCFCLSACIPPQKIKNHSSYDFSKVLIIGHRGYAGRLPENSLPGFIRATKRGVDAIELDVVVSKDNKVVVSHEPYMASDYMALPNGDPIAHKDEKNFNLYEMSYDDIKQFPLGLRRSKRFPAQRRVKTYKPLLSEVFQTVEHQLEKHELEPIMYFVEIKSDSLDYDTFQPFPSEFAELVVEVAKEKDLLDRTIFQSFDPQILNELHKYHPGLKTSFLVKNGKIEDNLKLLHFTPDYYAPYYKMISNKDYIQEVHDRNMKIITWTVNNPRIIEKLIEFGVDGIISDYPQKILRRL